MGIFGAVIEIYIMGTFKWLGAALGWSLGGPIGAIIGLALGSMGESLAKSEFTLLGSGEPEGSRRRQRPKYDYRQETQTQSRQRRQRPQTQSGDFEVSLLILASIVIKADGKQEQSELDYVRNYFSKMYGKDRANHAFKLFKNISKQSISARQVSLQIHDMMDHSSRLQLLHFLFGIAKADGMVTDDEVNQIHIISNYLGINQRDFGSIKAMFYNSRENAYKILEVDFNASDDEVKKAYRRMAKKYHPDKVAHLGEEHQKGAEEKFKQVQKAYELIEKERGF